MPMKSGLVGISGGDAIKQRKAFFEAAFLGETSFGQDRVVGSMMFEMTKPNFDSKCFDKISNLKDALEAEL